MASAGITRGTRYLLLACLALPASSCSERSEVRGAACSLGLKMPPEAAALYAESSDCVLRPAGRYAVDALDDALVWLTNHQEEDGRWDSRKHGSAKKVDAGVTGLAVLAFLWRWAPGNDETVRRAAQWIRESCRKGSMFESMESRGDGSMMFGQAICTMAVCEAYSMGLDTGLKTQAQEMIDFLVECQRPDSGWDYYPSGGEDGRADIIVTTWCVFAMKSAKVAGLAVNVRHFQGAINFLDAVTADEDGKAVGYSLESADKRYLDGTVRREGVTRAAYAAAARLSMGWTREEKVVQGAGELICEYPLEPDVWGGKIPFHYGYFAAFVTFDLGGHYFKRWHPKKRSWLVSSQRTEEDGDLAGSWDPGHGPVGRIGGRVMSTSLGVMILMTDLGFTSFPFF